MTRRNRGRPTKRPSVTDYFGNMSRFSEGSGRESENRGDGRSNDGSSSEENNDNPERTRPAALTRASTGWKVDMESLVSAADWIGAYAERQEATKERANAPKLIYYDDVVSHLS